MDRNAFFRLATLRITGSLNIEEALFSTIKFLRQHMPVSHMFLEYYDEGLDSMRTIAIATLSEGKAVNLLTTLSSTARQDAEKKYYLKQQGVYLFEHPTEERLAEEMLNYHRIKASSLMIMPLKSGDKILGTLAVVSQGGEKFSSHHAELLSFLNEPFAISMSNALKHREVSQLKDILSDENRLLRKEMRHMAGDEIIGAGFGLREVMEKVKKVVPIDSPVLLLGETGVGKDVIANAIHFLSARKDKPFVKVNCGAMPETLIDSELFGHEKGAFTGALAQKRGRFERANNGTIFLDEIGELPPPAQVRLLGVLQDKEIERVGGTKTIKLNIRIIAATNRNLEEMVKAGQFREDLWFRLNVFPIWLPPLRQRIYDIPALVQHFIKKKSKELKLPAIPSLVGNAIKPLMDYSWPGNIRELENVIERALILNTTGSVNFEFLGLEGKQTLTAIAQNAAAVDKLDDVIIRHIRLALSRANGKINGKDGAAELLDINPSTLRSRIEKMNIINKTEKK